MHDDIKITVVIPAYNRAAYLPAAIDSALAQTHKNTEIIVVDDGSTDNTKQVLAPYLDKIKYIYKQNGGVSSARNTGIKNATSQWIAFLDSDDRWRKQKLKTQINFILKNQIRLCFTDIEIEYTPNQASMEITSKTDNIKQQVYNEPFELILKETHGLCIQTMLAEKQLLIEAGCFDENMLVAEDTKLIYELAFKTPFGFIDQPLTILSRHLERNGLINQDKKIKLMLVNNHIKILSSAFEKSPALNKKHSIRLKKMLLHFYSVRAKYNAINKNYKNARTDSLKSLKLNASLSTYKRSLGILISPAAAGYFLRKNNKK